MHADGRSGPAHSLLGQLGAGGDGGRLNPRPRKHAELRERGYRGGYGTIRDYVQPFRELGAAPPATPAPPKTRDIASWILRDPDSLSDEEKTKLSQVTGGCPHLAALAGHVIEFARILTGRHGDRLDAWITAAEADDQPDLHSFAAASGTTTTPWSTGSPSHGAQASSKATSTGSR